MNQAERLFEAMAEVENRILDAVNRDDPDADYSELEPLSRKLSALLEEVRKLQLSDEGERAELLEMSSQLRQHLQERVTNIAALQKQIRKSLLKTSRGVKGTHAYQQMQGNPPRSGSGRK